MGNRLAALVSKPVRDFNIENRVEKVISAQKPRPAPRHPSDAKYEAETSLVGKSKILEKQEDLVERLRNVKVVSSDPQVQEKAPSPPPDRALPQSRSTPQQRKYGFFEPSVVPRGRLTLRQATQMLSDAQTEAARFTPQALAAQYALSEQNVHSVLKYFRVFKVIVPSEQESHKDLLGLDSTVASLAPGKKRSPSSKEPDPEDEDWHKSGNEEAKEGGRTPEDRKT